jgi:hypothetical protein
MGLMLISALTEARKFFRDDEMRSGTPGLDAVRGRMPEETHLGAESVAMRVVDASSIANLPQARVS